MLTILVIALLFTFSLYLKQNDYYRNLVSDLTAKAEKDQEVLQARLTDATEKINDLTRKLAKLENEKRTAGTLLLEMGNQKSGTPALPSITRKTAENLLQ